MPVFLVERNFAEELNVTPADAAGVNKINKELGVEWLISFLSADKKKTYCLYEASSVDEIRAAAERAGLPADVVIEVAVRQRAARLAAAWLLRPAADRQR